MKKKNTRVQHHILFKDLYKWWLFTQKKEHLFLKIKNKMNFFFTSNSLTKLETQKNYFKYVRVIKLYIYICTRKILYEV